MESITLHEKWELVSMEDIDLCMKSEIMEDIDLCMKSEIRCPWIMFTNTKQIIFCE